MDEHGPDPQRLDKTEQSGRPIILMAGIALLVLALVAMVIIFLVST